MKSAYLTAKEVIAAHKTKLLELAKMSERHGSLTFDQIESILGSRLLIGTMNDFYYGPEKKAA